MDTAPAPPLSAARRRTAIYCVALAGLAGVLMFWELGEDSLTSDEAQYALVVQNIRESGDWIYVSPYPPAPYLQKPPLYFWLTASTYRLFGEAEFAYRAWSAAAGVGAVVLTCVLGAMLFTPEVGGLAGLLLLLNRSFLFVHGARSGTFDALLTFLTVAGVVLYWIIARGRLAWVGWMFIGIIAGLASITKPFAGLPVIGLLAIHSLFVNRGSPWRLRLGGPALAILVLLIVAAPWYLAQWHKYSHFFDEVFRINLAQRVTRGVDGNVKSWKFYLQELSKTSPAFLLIIPAMLYTLAAWMKGPRRSQHALLALTGVGWVVLFSVSAAKLIHYVYPALPVLSVVLADAAIRLWEIISHRLGETSRPRVAVVAVTLLSALFTFQYAWTLYFAIPDRRTAYLPWEMHKALGPAIRESDVRVVFCGLPEHQIDWRTKLQLPARDCYYLKQMQAGSVALRNGGELAEFLRVEAPALLILSEQLDIRSLLADSKLKARTDARFDYSQQGFHLLGIDLQGVLEAVTTPAEPNASVRIEEAPSNGMFRLTLSPRVVGAGRISARVRLPENSSVTLVRYVLSLTLPNGDQKELEDRLASPVGDVVEVSAMIEVRLWQRPGSYPLTLTLLSAQPPTSEPVTSTLEEVRLTLLPHFPTEAHTKR